MRTCPTCQRQYLDTQNTCQVDGTPLPPPAPYYPPPPGQYQQAPPPGMNPMMPPQPPGYPPPGGFPNYPPPAYAGAGASGYAPCPKCQRPDPEKVGFTWWGGLLGPRLLSHVKCRWCGTTYNGKTGRDNTTGIVIYSIVAFVFFLGLFLVIFFALR